MPLALPPRPPIVNARAVNGSAKVNFTQAEPPSVGAGMTSVELRSPSNKGAPSTAPVFVVTVGAGTGSPVSTAGVRNASTALSA
jgi:hypothetical protein